MAYFQSQRSFEEVSQEIILQTARTKKALAVPALSEKRNSTSELQSKKNDHNAFWRDTEIGSHPRAGISDKNLLHTVLGCVAKYSLRF